MAKKEKKNIKENILVNLLLSKLFVIPSFLWIIIKFIFTDSLSWGFFLTRIIVPIYIWFVICYIINKDKYRKINNPKIQNPKLIKILMITLFIISLFSVNLSLTIVDFIKWKIYKTYYWICYLFIPFSILSIVLGFKYDSEKLKCQKNIIIGFIAFIFLFILGTFSFSYHYKDYDFIYKYQNILNIDLPKNGSIEIYDMTNNHKITYVYYLKEDTAKLENSIINNENWIQSNELDLDNTKYVPPEFFMGNEYWLFYNKTLNEYNNLRADNKKYNFYAISYNSEEKILEIHEYN